MADDKEVFNFEVGDKVRHAKWGIGTILQSVGRSGKMKVTVMFQEVGQKLLMVQYAGLEKLESGNGRREKVAPEPFKVPIADDEFEPIEAAITPDTDEEAEVDEVVIEEVSDVEPDSNDDEDEDTL